MERNTSDEFFDTYNKTPISKTKKFCYKKVEKNDNKSVIAKTTSPSSDKSSTTSPFFAKALCREQKTKTHIARCSDDIEEQLNHIFNGVSERTTTGSDIQFPKLLESNNASKINISLYKATAKEGTACGLTKDIMSNNKSGNIAPVFHFKKKETDASQKSERRAPYISKQDGRNITENCLEIPTIKRKPKFEFKNKQSTSALKINMSNISQRVNNKQCLEKPNTLLSFLSNSTSTGDINDFESDENSFLFNSREPDFSQKTEPKSPYCSSQGTIDITKNNCLENQSTRKCIPKFQFKNKHPTSALTVRTISNNSQSVKNKQSLKKIPHTILNNSTSIGDIDYESDNDFFLQSEPTKTSKLYSNQEVKFQTKVAEKETSNKKETNNKMFNQQKYCPGRSSISDHNPSSDNVFAKVKSDTTEKYSDTNSIEEFTSSPVIKPKKFIFKKKPTSSTNTLSPLIKEKSPDKNQSISNDLLFLANVDITPEKSTFIEENTRISISSTESFTESRISQKQKSNNLANVTKNLFSENVPLDDNITFVSQSLNTTDADYMTDEQFEKLFGSATDLNKINSDIDSDKTMSTLDEFNLNDVDWNEQFDSENSEKSHSQNVVCKEDSFSEITYGTENFSTTRRDDSRDFQGNYHFSEIMLEVLHQKFGLRSFRPRQKEIINASLNRHNCFVLMPTGGGKSLCYQLPAILSEGVTVVVSPLRALISDQVDKLNALDIPAAHLCSDVSKDEANQVLTKLHMREPAIKLLYLTPEKIMSSKNIMDVLSSLYQRSKLARFIIDEAHCLSQWGHDFRPDYKQLSILKRKFTEVPVMCLTATATKQVEQDVINSLSLKNVKMFILSFNRPNIKYRVITKSGSSISEIVQLLKEKFKNKSGIIYCLTRKDCESVAKTLCAAGIKTKYYHAGVRDKLREDVQREWMQDQFYVIVATIAFGMGIDKPDVRFVVHHSIPKSVEAFYQESGRAGRDGDISYSYLFYNYSDVIRLKKIIFLDRGASKKTLDGHMENLNQMVAFAENIVDCRRHLQLLHLGENFNRKICIENKETTCDNCENFNNHNIIDVSKEAKELGFLIQDLSKTSNITLMNAADVYRGSKQKRVLDKGYDRHKYFGAGQKMSILHVHRILKDLIMKNILADHHTYTGEFPMVYIKPGPKFNTLNSPNLNISIAISSDAGSVTKKSNDVYPKLDIIPVQPGPSTSKAKKRTPSRYEVSQIKVRCHEELLEECRRLALEKNVTLSSIMNLSAIKSMSEILPKTKEEFLKIQHITVANFKKFGEFFLKITKKFAEEVDSLQAEPEPETTQYSLDDNDWSTTSQGTKRKYTGGYQRGNKRYKKSYKRKPRSPGKKRATRGKAKRAKKQSPKAKAKTGGLSLMPVHIK